jgi:hypothetical protein
MHELRGEQMELEAFLKSGIRDNAGADRAANWKSRILELAKKPEEMRKAEKRPHDEAGRAVQEKFRPAIEITDALKKKVDAALTPYLRAKEHSLAAARAKQAADGEAIERPKSAKAGTTGRSVALTTVKTARITDANKLAIYLVDLPSPDLLDLLQKIANRIIRSGLTPPGCEVATDQVAR